MKRKVVKHGPSTLIISIPSGWAKKYGIKQGDELDVDEQESRLVVNTKGEKKLPEISINTSNLSNKLIERFLINSYQLGYDKINVIYDSPKKISFIQDKLQEFLGFEIIDRSNEGCVLKNIATKIDMDFDNALRKVFLIVNSMAGLTYEGYKKCDTKLLKSIPYKDVDVNKFAYFCLRTINKQHYIGNSEEGTHLLYHLIIKIESLGDCYKKLAKVLCKAEKSKDIEKLLLLIKNYYNGAYDFFYKPDKEKLNELLEMDQKIVKSIKDSFGKTKKVSQLLVLTMLSNITQLIYRIPIRTLNRLKINESFIKEF